MCEDTQVIEIIPNGKYVILVPERITMSEVDYLKEIINEWLDSDKQFLLLWGGLTLTRVDEHASD